MDHGVNGAVRNPAAVGSPQSRPRLVVGISGASGVVYGVRLLDALRELDVESHLVVTRAALLTLSQETDLSPDDLTGRADVTHRLTDVGASIASGSFRTLGMIIAPCSVRTMTSLAEMGAIIAPPLPAFYSKPASIAEMVDQSVGRVLDLFGLDWSPVKRWDGLKGPAAKE